MTGVQTCALPISACDAGGLGSIPGSGRSPGEGNSLSYSFLENSMDGGAWKATNLVKQRTILCKDYENIKCLEKCGDEFN